MELNNTLILGFVMCLVLGSVTLANFDAFSRSIVTLSENREGSTGAGKCKVFAMAVSVLLAVGQTTFIFFIICNGVRTGISECPSRAKEPNFEPEIEELINIESLQ